jgi:hypothetical protein
MVSTLPNVGESPEERAERRKRPWKEHRVSPEVYALLIAPYRGQSNLGEKPTAILGMLFDVEPSVKGVLPGVEIVRRV